MMRINLLPWRESRRQQRQRSFQYLSIAAVLVAGLGVLLTYMYFNQLIDHQNERNEYLRGEIALLKKAAAERKEMDRTRDRLMARVKVIQDLQASRPAMVRILDSIVRRLPENVFLTSVESVGKQLKLKGVASSNNVISGFMRNIADAPWFNEPSLTVVQTEQVNDVRASVFELAVARVRPKSSAEDEGNLE